MEFRKYTKEYEKLAQQFKCGNVVIDKFLRSSDALDENQGITYILMSDEQDFIAGYYNISVGRVDFAEIVGDTIYYKPMGGSANINYLAVSKELQHTPLVEKMKIYYGDYILHHCEVKIRELRQEIGIQFITLCSTEEGYHMYHDRNSYEDFEDDMSNFIQDSDTGSYKLYKCIDDIAM